MWTRRRGGQSTSSRCRSGYGSVLICGLLLLATSRVHAAPASTLQPISATYLEYSGTTQPPFVGSAPTPMPKPDDPDSCGRGPKACGTWSELAPPASHMFSNGTLVRLDDGSLGASTQTSGQHGHESFVKVVTGVSVACSDLEQLCANKTLIDTLTSLELTDCTILQTSMFSPCPFKQLVSLRVKLPLSNASDASDPLAIPSIPPSQSTFGTDSNESSDTVKDVEGRLHLTVHAGAFAGLTTLVTLDLSSAGILDLPAHAFQGLEVLSNLVLFGNSLTSLNLTIFDDLPLLGCLDLSCNPQLSAIQPGTFTALTRLQSLYLYRNGLVDLPDGVFQGLCALGNIDLSFNRITRLSVGFSQDMCVKTLSIQNNAIQTIRWNDDVCVDFVDARNNNVSFFQYIHDGFEDRPNAAGSSSALHAAPSAPATAVPYAIGKSATDTAARRSHQSFGIGSCTARKEVLSTLILSNNSMTECCSSFVHMKDLKIVDLYDNSKLNNITATGVSNSNNNRIVIVNLLKTSLQSVSPWAFTHMGWSDLVPLFVLPKALHVECRAEPLSSGNVVASTCSCEGLQLLPRGRNHPCRDDTTVVFILVGVGSALLAALVQTVIVVFVRRYKRRLRKTQARLAAREQMLEEQQRDIDELKRAWQIDAHEIHFIRRVGRGASGEVWRAQLGVLPVAVKKLHRLQSADQTTLDQFTREVEFLMRWRHPNLIRFLGTGQDEGIPILVMEYMPNGNLKQYLRNTRRALDWPRRLDFAFDIAAGLAFVHSLGKMHRDVKPDNVLLDSTLRCKLGDFGTVRDIMARGTFVDDAQNLSTTETSAAASKQKTHRTVSRDDEQAQGNQHRRNVSWGGQSSLVAHTKSARRASASDSVGDGQRFNASDGDDVSSSGNEDATDQESQHDSENAPLLSIHSATKAIHRRREKRLRRRRKARNTSVDVEPCIAKEQQEKSAASPLTDVSSGRGPPVSNANSRQRHGASRTSAGDRGADPEEEYTCSTPEQLTSRLGTRFYMAPEMFGDEPYTYSADVFSFGIVLWEIASRREPDLLAERARRDSEAQELTDVLDDQSPAAAVISSPNYAAAGSVQSVASIVADRHDMELDASPTPQYKIKSASAANGDCASDKPAGTSHGSAYKPMLLRALQTGQRLPFEASWPKAYCSLISHCWQTVPDQRPTMELARRQLEGLIAEIERGETTDDADDRLGWTITSHGMVSLNGSRA